MELKEVKVSAPGKIILFGEHAVVYGKRAIATSIGLRTRCSITPIETDEKQLIIERQDITNEILTIPMELLINLQKQTLQHVDLTNEDSPKFSLEISELISNFLTSSLPSNSQKLIDKGVISLIAAFTTILPNLTEIPSLKLTISSEVPIGAGLGSSAAMSVCYSSSLLILSEQIKKTNKYENEMNLLRNVANNWALELEKIMHGPTASGIDNLISTYGGTVTFSKTMPDKPSFTQFWPQSPHFRIIITNTNVSRNTKTLVENVGKLYRMFPPVIENILISIEEITNQFLLTQEIESLEERENKISELIKINHDLLCTIRVGHPSFDILKDFLSSKYNFSTKLTGAGGGGCAITFIPSSFSELDLAEAINGIQSLSGNYNYNYKGFLTSIGSEGLSVDL